MNDDSINKGIRQLKNIALSAEEKEAMLLRVSNYANENPIKISSNADENSLSINSKGGIRGIPSPFTWIVFVSRSRYAYVAAAVVLVLTCGGTAMAAEYSSPGDLLYPVKIHVTEPVQGALKVSAEAKAKWEGKKAVRRLEEAAKLAEKGKLDTPKRVQIEKEFERNADAFNAKIHKVNIDIQNKKVKKGEEKIELNIQTNAEAEVVDMGNEKEAAAQLDFHVNVEQRLEKINERKDSSSDEQKEEIMNLEVKIKEKIDSKLQIN